MAIDFCVEIGHHLLEKFKELVDPPYGLNQIIWVDMVGVA